MCLLASYRKKQYESKIVLMIEILNRSGASVEREQLTFQVNDLSPKLEKADAHNLKCKERGKGENWTSAIGVVRGRD